MAERDSSNRESETTLYVLKLQKGKYYVGSTSNLHKRFQDHCSGNGAAWTKKYPPIKIEDQRTGSKFLEDGLVYECMSRYGIQNVRGGTYSSIKLSKESVAAIKRQFDHRDDKCFNCGEAGHFIRSCPRMRSLNPYQRSKPVNKKQRLVCERCGRDSHTQEDCFASRHISGELLVQEDWTDSDSSSDSEDEGIEVIEAPRQFDNFAGRGRGRHQGGCQRCGRSSHTIDRCVASFHANGDTLDQEEESDDEVQGVPWGCQRCGRSSHTIDRCVASFHANGEPLDQEEDEDESSDEEVQDGFFNAFSTTCFRCGREGHYQSNCYARKDVNGRKLD